MSKNDDELTPEQIARGWYRPGIIEGSIDWLVGEIYFWSGIARIMPIALRIIVNYVLVWRTCDGNEIDRRIAREVFIVARRKRSRQLRYISAFSWELYKYNIDKESNDQQ